MELHNYKCPKCGRQYALSYTTQTKIGLVTYSIKIVPKVPYEAKTEFYEVLNQSTQKQMRRLKVTELSITCECGYWGIVPTCARPQIFTTIGGKHPKPVDAATFAMKNRLKNAPLRDEDEGLL